MRKEESLYQISIQVEPGEVHAVYQTVYFDDDEHGNEHQVGRRHRTVVYTEEEQPETTEPLLLGVLTQVFG